MKLLTNVERVRNLLESNEDSRDNDQNLLVMVWGMRLREMGYRLSTLSSATLLMMIAEGQLPPAESIRRVRQKLQQENPRLRGDLWDGRHEHQKDVKRELVEIS
jgi:hypothetical protein